MYVVDAGVILAGLRSRNGASHVILRQMIKGGIPFAISPAIALEYEDVLKRPGILGDKPWIATKEIDIVLDAIIASAKLVSPWFRLRPFLSDPKDDIYVECALAAGAGAIISNDRHFRNPALRGFGLSAINAGAFVAELRRNEST